MNIFQGTFTIKSITTVARETKKFYFQVKDYTSLDEKTSGTGKLPFEAGQFINIKFREKLERAYSIASAPNEELIELVIRIIPDGAGSMVLDKARVGDSFPFKGPFGHFVLSNNPKANLVFCGTGTGIAPLRSMILTEMENTNPRPMQLLYGGRDLEDIAYTEEIDTWAPNLKIQLGLSREENASKLGPYGEHCRITKFIEEGDFNNKSEFYICGNGSMVKGTLKLLAEKGVDKKKIFMERFN